MADTGVAAVVVNWNGREFLEPCLDSLAAVTSKGLSIIVVDNNSTDGSAELVRERYPGAVLLVNDENVGYAAAANAGIELARRADADYALLLNNDVEVAPDAVEALVAEARRRPNAAFLGPMIYYHDLPNLIWSAGGAISYWTGDIRHIGLRDEDRGQYEVAAPVDYVTGCAVLVSLAALETVGPMDVGYFMYNEDTDWCVRAVRTGFEVLLVPDAKAWHRVSMSSGGGLTSFKVYHRFLSTFRFFRLHARPYHWIGIVPATAWRTLVFSVRELMAGRGANASAVLRGVVDSITGKGRAA